MPLGRIKRAFKHFPVSLFRASPMRRSPSTRADTQRFTTIRRARRARYNRFKPTNT